MAEPSGSIVPVVTGVVAGGGGGASEDIEASGGAGGERGGREYRKGNWTLQETMILIEAKRMDDDRRLKGGDKEKGKSAEFRWKWVENYCWKSGCQRSQNQCNDKWDNLLRDYKKVREYESKVSSNPAPGPGVQPPKSYWQLEKHERKERGLPSNMITQVYEALHEVVDRRPRPVLPQHQQQQPQLQLQAAQAQAQAQTQFHQIHQHVVAAAAAQQMFSGGGAAPPPQIHLPPGPGPSNIHQQQPGPPPSATEISRSTESEGSEEPRSPSTKRRRVSSTSREPGLAPTVSRSAQELSQTLLACEEKKDKRHRDLLSVEERKLVLEEAKTEISRQGMEGLIAAVNNLSNAILTLASDRQPAPG